MLNNIYISREKRTVHLLMMTESKPHSQVATRTYGEAIRFLVECRQQRSFPNSE